MVRKRYTCSNMADLRSYLYRKFQGSHNIESIHVEGDEDWEKEANENGVRGVACSAKMAVVKCKDGEKLVLFIKACEQGTTAYFLNNSLKIFEREAFFYTEILPAIFEFEDTEKNSSVSADKLRPLFLECFGGISIGDNKYIVLKKFHSDDYFITKSEQFHTLSQIKYWMKNIGLYHATTFSMNQKNKFKWADHPLLKDKLFDPASANVIGGYFKSYFKNNLKVLKAMKEEIRIKNDLVKGCTLSFNCLNEQVLDRLEKLIPHISTILSKTQQCPDELRVLNHGDFHMWNVCFSNKEKMEGKFFDFQLIRFTSGLIDVHHFLSQVCTPATRNKHLPEFLNQYHTTFQATCRAYGVENNVYTMEEINKEYMLRSAWGFFFGFLYILPRFVSKDFYQLLEEKEDSSDIVNLLSDKGSENVWSVLEMYVDMLQIEDDLGTIEIMEKLAFTENSS